MSPKKITRLAIMVAAISILGGLAMAVWQPDWGLLSWWPAMGLGLALLLLLLSLLRGAYLSMQRRAGMVDMLNDCYSGVTERPPSSGKLS